MIKFFKTLTSTVLLSGLLITILDPVLRQSMLEGDNIVISFKDRVTDYFENPTFSEQTIIEVEIPTKDENIEDNDNSTTTNPPVEDDNNQDISNDNNEEIEDNEEEKNDDTPSVTIKPFPNIGKDDGNDDEDEDNNPEIEDEKTPVEPDPEPTPEPTPSYPTINPSFTPVYYNQSKDEIGYSSVCLLTSYAMVITNAGRYNGNSKEYNPIDLYLANNPDATAANQRRILAYHYVIANGFNYTWRNTVMSGWSDSNKINKVTELLINNPWGVIIGGVYGENGTHYIVVRLVNGKLVFIQSISGVYGINSWSKITSIMTITPNLDKNGVWADGLYETKKKNPSAYHPCQTQMYC